jgi:hypothetical protein
VSFADKDDDQARQGAGRSNCGKDARAECKTKTGREEPNCRQAWPWILVKRAHDGEEQNGHGGCEGGVLRVHEHMTVVKRARRKQQERNQSCDLSAKPPADAPGRDQAENSDRGSDKTPCFEQPERQHLRRECRSHIEAAAVFIQVDE